MRLLISAVDLFAQVIIYLLIGRALLSWFVRPGNAAYRIYNMLAALTDPIVAPCRKLTSRFPTGTLDFSVLLALVLVMVARDLLIRLLVMLAVGV